jgi:hypothetical protein
VSQTIKCAADEKVELVLEANQRALTQLAACPFRSNTDSAERIRCVDVGAIALNSSLIFWNANTTLSDDVMVKLIHC